MEISGFSSLIELAAALNVAFVAVEYAKGYTHILSTKVFGFPTDIDREFDNCHKCVADLETAKNLKPVNIDGRSTAIEIEKCRRDLELLDEEIKTEKKNLMKDIETLCEYKSFSSLSLWSLLFCVTSLFLCGIESTHGAISHFIFSGIGFFSLLFFIIGWFKGDKEKFKYFDYSLLRHATFLFLGVLSIIWLLSYVISDYLAHFNVFHFLIPFFAIVPYFNFIAFFFKVRKKAKKIRLDIKTKATRMDSNYQSTRSTLDVLLATGSMSKKLAISDEPK